MNSKRNLFIRCLQFKPGSIPYNYIIYTLYPGFELFACPNDLQIGQAKITKKLNEPRNPMGIFHVLQALLPDQFELHPILN
jgi:hypothetical protein